MCDGIQLYFRYLLPKNVLELRAYCAGIIARFQVNVHQECAEIITTMCWNYGPRALELWAVHLVIRIKECRNCEHMLPDFDTD